MMLNVFAYQKISFTNIFLVYAKLINEGIVEQRNLKVSVHVLS